jgi:sec-independent protein translocase protein TatC
VAVTPEIHIRQREEDVPKPLWEHLDELRKRLLLALGGWFVTTAVAWAYSQRILDWIVRPPVTKLVFTSPAEPFLALIKTSIYAGLVVAFPWVSWQVWAFIKPGLKENERRWVTSLVVPSYALFLLGCAVGFYGAGPVGLKFLMSFATEKLQPYISLNAYLGYIAYLSLGCGILFQLPIVLWLLAKIGIIDAGTLSKYRRHVFLGILIAAAAITPSPDISGQVLITLPTYVLYELSILVVRLTI